MEKEKVKEYVANQKEHHKTETFHNEYKRLLIENGIEFNEKYLVDCSTPSGLVQLSFHNPRWYRLPMHISYKSKRRSLG